MFFFIHEFATFSIAFAVIIGWIRFQRTAPVFLPLLCILTLGLCNEILSHLLMYNGHPNALNSNIYLLLESVFIAWQFKKWGLFRRAPWGFYVLSCLYILTWAVEGSFFSLTMRFSSYFIAAYSFFTVLLSISFINLLMGEEQGSFLKSPSFIICIGFIIYYTYAVLIEIFYLYGLKSGGEFGTNIYHIHTYINLLSNLIYATAFLWIPRKREFILL